MWAMLFQVYGHPRLLPSATLFVPACAPAYAWDTDWAMAQARQLLAKAAHMAAAWHSGWQNDHQMAYSQTATRTRDVTVLERRAGGPGRVLEPGGRESSLPVRDLASAAASLRDRAPASHCARSRTQASTTP
jgi:hypothetical protein